MTTITSGSECLYGARREIDKTTGRERLIGGMVCRVICIEEDEAWCQSLATSERFTVKVPMLELNQTEGS